MFFKISSTESLFWVFNGGRVLSSVGDSAWSSGATTEGGVGKESESTPFSSATDSNRLCDSDLA